MAAAFCKNSNLEANFALPILIKNYSVKYLYALIVGLTNHEEAMNSDRRKSCFPLPIDLR
jgi:hypothetical protein